jgi:hypothetical protein
MAAIAAIRQIALFSWDFRAHDIPVMQVLPRTMPDRPAAQAGPLRPGLHGPA